MKLDSIILTQDQIFLTTDPLPVTGVTEWKSKDGATLGSSIEVVIPRRNFEKIAVKVKGCPLYKTFNPDKPMMAASTGVTARAYAFAGKQGIISGWAATAESVELSDGFDFLCFGGFVF